LLHNGFIIPQPPNSPPLTFTLEKYALTRRGLQWVEGSEPIPEEATGYMKILRGLVPNLDSIIEQYIVEALSSFERRTLFAAAVMVGAAAEKGVYLLADAMLHSLRDSTKQTKLRTLIEQRKLSALFDALEKNINAARHIIPYPIFDESVSHLMSLFESIRVQRNDAVHPMNAAVSRDSAAFHCSRSLTQSRSSNHCERGSYQIRKRFKSL
jgi:hypothetical protein